MIDEKLLLEFIKTKKDEFEEEGFTNYKKYTSTLKNMESMEAITATVDIHVLINLTRILNELIEMIENGKFDVIEDPKKRRSNMAENHILTEKLHAINKLLNDLYEGIDENYTEALENNDELTIIRAKTELDLITKILDEVDEI